jgi:hypothetical protein
MHKPVIYQQIDGSRRPIAGDYVIKAGQTVSFQVAAYDATRPLIIDPVLVYFTYLGGNEAMIGNGEGALDIAVDRRGQAYITGITAAIDFPTVNAAQPVSGSASSDPTNDADAFVAKLSADGKTILYATYLGGSEFDFGRGIAVDLRGQAYVTGETESRIFPTKDALQPTFGGGNTDAFIARLSADGRTLRYSTYLGGNGSEGGSGIAVDLQGQVYVTGSTSSTDFPTANALQPGLAGHRSDAFVAKIRNDGQR